MRRLSIVFACLFSVLSGPVMAQEDGARYPALGQGDLTPGTPNLPQNLELTVAAGIATQPEYMGSDDYEVIFKPAIDLEYHQRGFLVIDRQSMMTPYEGLGVKLIANQDVSAGFNLTYDEGRDVDNGLGDRDWTALGGVFAAYHPGPFYVRGQVGYDLLNEFDGYKGEFGAGYGGPINPYLRGNIDIGTAFAGDGYNESYFGVTNAQSAASGLSPYNPSGGFYRMGIAGTLQYQFTQGAFIQGIARWDQLIGDAKDSSISVDDSQFALQGMVGYHF